MADPFIGEVRAFGFDFAPTNWAFCAGQTVPLQQNSTLFSIIGNRFGGNGSTNFMLPNLQSRVAMGAGSGPGLTARNIGDAVGTATETLAITQIPPHTHHITAQNTDASAPLPDTNMLAKGVQGVPPRVSARQTYAPGKPTSALAPAALLPTGGGQPHSNTQPFLALNFCICLYGDFPPRP